MISASFKLSTFRKAIIAFWFFAYITGIPYKAVPLVPVGALLVFFTFFKHIKKYLTCYAVTARRIILAVILLAIFRFYLLYLSGAHYKLFNSAHIGYFVNAVVFGYLVSGGINRVNWAVKTILYIFIFSMIFYFGNVFIGAPFSGIWHYLYGQFISDGQAISSIQLLPRGLTAWLHVFGYHMVFLFTFLVIYILEKGTLSLYSVLLLAGSYISILFIGERAFVFSIGITLILYIFHRFRSLIIMQKALIVGIFLMLIFVISTRQYLDLFSKSTLLARVLNYQLYMEAISRVELQKLSFILLFKYPLGLHVAGERWMNAILSHHPMIFTTWGREISPHNGYLTFTLPLGLLGFIAIIIILYYLIREIISLLKYEGLSRADSKIIVPISFSFIAVLLHAIWHNSSLFSLEQSTTLGMFSILSLLSIKKQHTSCKAK